LKTPACSTGNQRSSRTGHRVPGAKIVGAGNNLPVPAGALIDLGDATLSPDSWMRIRT
jgi:hypothetical protein